MLPLTLMFFDPAHAEIDAALKVGRVAALFSDPELSRGARKAFHEPARSSVFIPADSGSLRSIADAMRTEGVTKGHESEDLLRACFGLIGVPHGVVVTKSDAFRSLIAVLTGLQRQPRALRFVGWSAGRRDLLLELGFRDFRVSAGGSGSIATDLAAWSAPWSAAGAVDEVPFSPECVVNARQ